MKTLDRYIVVEVWKSGEKAKKVYRGRKPQGYKVYKNGLYESFLPYGENPVYLIEKNEEIV